MIELASSSCRLVCVLEDDGAVRCSLKFALELEGFVVELFSSSEALLEAIVLEAAGCLIINYRMPSMNGLELAVRLRARGIHAPIILATSHARDRDLRIDGLANVNVIEKPYLDNCMMDCVHRAFAQRGSSPFHADG